MSYINKFRKLISAECQGLQEISEKIKQVKEVERRLISEISFFTQIGIHIYNNAHRDTDVSYVLLLFFILFVQ